MREEPLKVLLVEDNAGDARLLREMFSKENPGSFELTHLIRMSEALTHLENGGVDIVLLDLGLPDGQGIETVQRALAAAPGVPLIVLTGLDDEALAAQAMKEGAQDYLIKGQIENRALPRALRHAIERHRMQAEADLVRTHQMEFKDEFLSHVSHELRSPLTAVYQFVTILLDRLAGELNPEQDEYLKIVLRNVNQLHSMINDLLEVTGAQAGKLTIELQSTPVGDAIDYTIETLQGAAAAKAIALSAEMENGLPPALADPMRVRQILIILVDNAIKFTPANGVVTVRARMLDGDQNFLLLEVSDSGCGIGPDMTERIFERLVQASDPAIAGRKGLGLGLYICKELVTRQGGQIWAKNAPEQGAVISVTLPVFSLRSLLAPALEKGRRTACTVTLVVTELSSQAGWFSEEVRAGDSQAVRALLQECLHSDLDVLLPKMGTAEAAEIFFIAAIADGAGGEAITKRIREQLDRSGYVEQAGLTYCTSYRSLEPIMRTEDESIGEFPDKVAASVQRLIAEELSMRPVRAGSSEDADRA